MNRPEGFPPGRPLLYAWRVFAKWLSFAVFGLGTVFLVTALFPPLRFFLRPRRRFQRRARLLISRAFRLFIGFMTVLGVARLEPGDREAYRNLAGKIVAANHPSLLDVVTLISLIPNANCLVRGSLKGTLVSGVIRQLYIPNNLGFARLVKECAAALDEGDCLIIFPEGSRTPRTGKPVFKRGAARIALASRRGIVPVHIGGADKYGLGKNDPWTAFNPRERYVYRLRMLKELSPDTYLAGPPSLGARRLTRELYRVLVEGPP
ncbi:MAG: 1-acyl-sn-glycerol-3-phosphate acyltransferase [Treponema sp.]|jgi:1-acyl-sn-glycerol-3-phosphate acyltransferase|nr:1-acyl-sn-glycerol-3-phosphate acyltransferase [Treponema sp.]